MAAPWSSPRWANSMHSAAIVCIARVWDGPDQGDDAAARGRAFNRALLRQFVNMMQPYPVGTRVRLVISAGALIHLSYLEDGNDRSR